MLAEPRPIWEVRPFRSDSSQDVRTPFERLRLVTFAVAAEEPESQNTRVSLANTFFKAVEVSFASPTNQELRARSPTVRVIRASILGSRLYLLAVLLRAAYASESRFSTSTRAALLACLAARLCAAISMICWIRVSDFEKLSPATHTSRMTSRAGASAGQARTAATSASPKPAILKARRSSLAGKYRKKER